MSVSVTLFYNPTCPYCHMAMDFFATELPDVPLDLVELGKGDGRERDMFLGNLTMCNLGARAIPLIVIGDQCFQGFDKKIAAQIKRRIRGDSD